MDFGWALQRMRAGQAVRRQSWAVYAATAASGYESAELVTDLPGYKPMLVAVLTNGNRAPFRLNDAQVLAEDWELAD